VYGIVSPVQLHVFPRAFW